MIAVYFILYRLVVGVIYGACERWCDDKEFRLLEEPDLLLGMIGNIFCFSVSDVYKCHKKDQCGGKCFGWYYFVYYAENAALLFLWYSDDQALLELKNGRSCTNHEWYAPYPLFLFLYYRLLRKQQQSKAINTADDTDSQTGSSDSTSSISSDSCSNDIHYDQSLRRHPNILQESSRRQQWENHNELDNIYHTQIDQHFDNHGFQDRRQTSDYNYGHLGDNYDYGDRRSSYLQLQRYDRTHQRDDRYRGEREHVMELHHLEENHRWSNYSYGDERQNFQSIPEHGIHQLKHWGNCHSQNGSLNNQQTYMGWPVNANNPHTHFASRFHNQSVVRNSGYVNSSFQSSKQSMTQSTAITFGQYDSSCDNMFSGY
ncbi:unnamed protein product [Mytilus coruscus]|uniref:XK-related protein n=1 Tax=Mytilus coruscus TaxID=42192 RepID=A0A6J8E601_MYTCO|nr:unnamed protein product [Mytilus coruscus]